MKKSFSLVELLVSLIIISLLLAAFSPIFIKKMKANDITVGSFGTKENLQIEQREIKEEDCAKFNAAFVPAKYNGENGKNLCVTKYNVGDFSIPFAKNTTVVNVGEACNSGDCCWKGITSESYTTNRNADSYYSGQTRTVCQFMAGYNACKSYAPSGTKAGDWRLPTLKEALGWGEGLGELNANQGQKGLQLCDGYSEEIGTDRCSWRYNDCKNATSNHNCHPYMLMATTEINAINRVGVGFYGVEQNLPYYGEFIDNSIDYTSSVRCVLDNISDVVKEELNLETKEPQGQLDCDKIAPNTMFIEKRYNDGYHNVCVTKYNVGDKGGPPLGPGVIQGGAGKCAARNCCWQNITTSSDCTGSNGDSTYSSCNRTACQMEAGKISCENWAPNGKYKGYWRLPNKAESDGWASTINNLDYKDVPTLTTNMGSKGLQLCSYRAHKGNMTCLFSDGGCQGSGGNYCHTCNLHVAPEYEFGFNDVHAISVRPTDNNVNLDWAYSVRCVFDGKNHLTD